ncbi:hypothetical protein ELI74_30425, partial [Klebsiella pneumoniae]|nr:hypothetical protein [Klebsiella pneumoniae]
LAGYLMNRVKGEIMIIGKASQFYANLFEIKSDNWFVQIFLSHGILVYLAIIIAIVAQVILNRTRIGLHLRAVGESPSTADATGINVTGY